MTHTLQTAGFCFAWVLIVVALFVVQHYVRRAATRIANFCRVYVAPILKRIDDVLESYTGTLLLVGILVTTFGTLMCAASTKWIGITDVSGFTCGVITLAIGMIVTVKAGD